MLWYASQNFTHSIFSELFKGVAGFATVTEAVLAHTGLGALGAFIGFTGISTGCCLIKWQEDKSDTSAEQQRQACEFACCFSHPLKRSPGLQHALSG